MGRIRNIALHLWLTKNEKELIKTVSDLKGISMTNLIIDLVKKEYEKLIQRKEE